jgi:Grx4 family monothiol glutaredoxin
MKGSPQEPRCGFSRQIVQLLEEEGVVFDSFDIMGDNAVREGLKKLSNWPTYPQLYAGGKLVGGLDVVKELRDEGELKDPLALQPPPVVDDAFLKALTARSPVVLLIKGSPQEPRCGFSRQIVQLREGQPSQRLELNDGDGHGQAWHALRGYGGRWFVRHSSRRVSCRRQALECVRLRANLSRARRASMGNQRQWRKSSVLTPSLGSAASATLARHPARGYRLLL